MATGTVFYWNGDSGWIKQTGAEQLPTILARDVMILQQHVVSGTVDLNSSVEFTVDMGQESWLAKDVTVT